MLTRVDLRAVHHGATKAFRPVPIHPGSHGERATKEDAHWEAIEEMVAKDDVRWDSMLESLDCPGRRHGLGATTDAGEP